MLKDILTDIVAHTHSLGFLTLSKITGDDKSTVIESMSEDRTVILTGTTNNPIPEFKGMIGLPNMEKLNFHLKNPEYKENAKITVVTAMRNDEEIPTGLHFENEAGDFENDYRFMSAELINEKLKSVKFKGTNWNIEFEPNLSAIQRLKLQATANSGEDVFRVKTDNGDLILYFGDASSHAGSFIFQHGLTGKLKNSWLWPIAQVTSILNLDGKIVMKISDDGVMQITVNSGIAEYNYFLPAMTK